MKEIGSDEGNCPGEEEEFDNKAITETTNIYRPERIECCPDLSTGEPLLPFRVYRLRLAAHFGKKCYLGS
jgi:hypothetical protein